MIRIRTRFIFRALVEDSKALVSTLVASVSVMIQSTTDVLILECDHFLEDGELVAESTFPA